jgi:hypothetical protein
MATRLPDAAVLTIPNFMSSLPYSSYLLSESEKEDTEKQVSFIIYENKQKEISQDFKIIFHYSYHLHNCMF